MPYITKFERDRYDRILKQLSGYYLDNPGNLNYILTSICLLYLKEKHTSYQTFNDIVGVLECSKQELYRRFVAAYEQEKIEQNGDIVQT